MRKGHLAAVVGILFEEAAESAELLRQALGVVEAVDAQEADGRRRLLAAALGARADEGIDVDADREAGDRQLAIEGADAAVLQDATEHAVLQVVDEVADIDLGLQTDEIVGGKAASQLAVLGDGEERLRRRHGDVQEEPDWVGDAERAQLHAERDHVIVVHPDRVVRLQQRPQRLSEALVHVEVALIVAGLELRDVEAGVKHRPQYVVGVAGVVGSSCSRALSGSVAMVVPADSVKSGVVRSSSLRSPILPLQPSQSPLRARKVSAMATATPPAWLALLRSATRLETRYDTAHTSPVGQRRRELTSLTGTNL